MVFFKLTASMAVAALSVLPYVSASSHFIMGGLSPIAYERIDPIVNKGMVRRPIVFPPNDSPDGLMLFVILPVRSARTFTPLSARAIWTRTRITTLSVMPAALRFPSRLWIRVFTGL